MASAGGNNNGGSRNAYEQQQRENIERNKRRLADLNIRELVNGMGQQGQPRKKQKRQRNTSVPTAERPNLRPRPQRNFQSEQVLPDLEPVGDFLNNNNDVNNSDLSNGTKKKRSGRGVTKKDDIFSRTPDMPKLKIILNDRGQPVGKNSRQLSSVIGCQVRKTLPLASVDWRLVDAKKKYDLWTGIKAIYDIEDEALNWVMRTAGKKWKEFKATIKELYFVPGLAIDHIGECPDKRVNDGDWEYLYKYWSSAEFQARSENAKESRAKLEMLHTSGSVSYACSEYDLAQKLGHPPRRDEVFIKTHTRKNGVPSLQAAPIINRLKEIVEAHPELKERTIQEGDAFAAVCGEKEPRGYVRAMGLGPTPQDVRTPGLKCYAPTRLQVEIFARMKAESDKAALEEHVRELQAQVEQRGQQDRASTEPMSQHDSCSRQHLNTCLDAGREQGDEDYATGDDDDDQFDDEMHGAALSRPAGHIETIPRTSDSSRSEHDDLVGKDVILYALLRSEQPVAKGTIVSVRPSTLVGGEPLGREFCEVIVTCVLKRDEVLPRPYADMQTMGDTRMMSIAWPYKKLKITNKAPTPPTSGIARR